MAWMNRQDNSGGVQGDYLNAADTATRPMAIASLLLTLVLIGAIALMLFSVGRWAYNRFNQTDANVATTSDSQTANESGQDESSQQPTTPPAESDASSTSQSQGDTDNANTASSQQTNTAQSEQGQSGATVATPTTGASLPETVPNTGPNSTLAYFLLSSMLATTAAYGWQIKRNHT